MFNLPVTILYHTPAEIILLSAGVDIDNIVKVEPISLDKGSPSDIDSYDNCRHVPHTLLHLSDGRKLPVREVPSEINVYLDAYRKLDQFFTTPPVERSKPVREGLRLISGGLCDSSEASTPA